MFFSFCALSLSALIAISECDIGKTTRYWDCCKASCAWPHKFDSIGLPNTPGFAIIVIINSI